MKKNYIQTSLEKWTFIPLFLFLFSISVSNAQSVIYAQNIVSESNVDNSANAIDQNQSTFAVVRASTGIAVGIGSYSGHIELEFPTTLHANTTTFVKVEAEDNLFDVLLGGSLGNLLSDVLGIVIIGNQEFTIQAKLDNTVIQTGNSQIVNDFASPNLKVVINAAGEHFIAITPNADYNRIRLTNRVGSLLGLNNVKELHVYGAFYMDETSECGRPLYTSYDGNGLNLDLINLAGAGVDNPEYAIDTDINSYSELSLGVLSVAASIEQVVYFGGLSNTNDVFNIRLRVDPSLLAIGVANNINITAYDGTTVASSINLNSLLNLELINLMQSNQIVTIPYTPGMPVDRIMLRYTSLLNTTIFQKLDLYDIERVPPAPTIDANSQNVAICAGNIANLVAYADPNTLQLYWYDVPNGGTPIAIVNSGEAFTTPVLTTTTSFYVAARNPNCNEESQRVEVVVTVNQTPTANDIDVSGAENAICAIDEVVLTPSSTTVSGTFNWYFDANATTEITNGLVVGNISYAIDSNGVLTITGLNITDSPATYYVSITDATTSCSNAPGDLKGVTITITDEATPTTNNSTQEFCLLSNATINDIQVNESPINWYATLTGGTPLDPSTSLTNNTTYYAAFVGATCESSIRLEVTVMISDEMTPTTNNTTQEFCNSQNATVNDLQVNESPVNWYATPTGGTPLATTTLLTDNTTYYAALVGAACESSVRLEVTVNLTTDSQASISGDFANVCYSNEYTYTTESSMSDYQWTVTGGTITAGGSVSSDFVTVNWNQTTVGNVSVSYSSPSLCNGTASFSQDITINSCSDITITKVADNAIVAIGETVVFTITVHNNGISNINDIQVSENLPSGYTYVSNTTTNGNYNISTGIWTIDSLLANQSAVLQVTVTVNASGNYTNTASIIDSDPLDTDLDNNNATAEVEVSCLIVYNEFSPNNDGQNEHFIIDCIEKYPNNKLEVFNRYGNIVYETSSYKNTWNGVANVSGVVNQGETLPVGTYFYTLKIDDLNMTQSGWLYIAK
ncbi:gliding motility-associated C-terminal domain-containing protein [Flavobacterium sp. J27]|uniref:Ig-like domain-containing protein n=1 Tax=Flavobacterium sp. J27 TaxID=2060419 RepID=UPI00103255AC|nr:gliding motility-associated C-terminal domain-containing protein [Flavobacterium sp. J27]